MKKKRKKTRRRRVGLTVFLIVLLVAALGTVMVWKVFVVKKVEVVGNEIYSDKQIENWVMGDEYSWNSLYVYFKHRFHKSEEIPFVDSMEITLKSPQTVQVKVAEKGILGYIYVPSLAQYAYFDKDGFVVELSTDTVEGVTKISGLSVESATLYEKLPLQSRSILRTLLSLTQLLEKYQRMPEHIFIRDDSVLLDYGEIQVDMGSGVYLNEKVIRMDQILPELEGQQGTLHLENWTENSTDVYFKIGEAEEIPETAPEP